MSFLRFTIAAVSIALGSGTALAAGNSDAQEQARAMLSGAGSRHIESAPASVSVDDDSMPRDPQVRAQWLLAGRPGIGAATQAQSPEDFNAVASVAGERTAGSDASELARRILGGKGH